MASNGPDIPSFFRLERHETLDSSNRLALERARESADEGLIILADRQTSGRGRQGREWVSPPGNLYMSVLLWPDAPPAQAAQLSFVAAVAMAEAVENLLPPYAAQVSCKWPNDILLGGEKLVGILLEAQRDPTGRLALVIGIGANVQSHPPISDTRLPATALVLHNPRADRDALLSAAAHRLYFWYSAWRGQGFSPVRDAWLSRAEGLNAPILIRLPHGDRQGVFRGLDAQGGLLLEEGPGQIHTYTAGEVFRLHTA